MFSFPIKGSKKDLLGEDVKIFLFVLQMHIYNEEFYKKKLIES